MLGTSMAMRVNGTTTTATVATALVANGGGGGSSSPGAQQRPPRIADDDNDDADREELKYRKHKRRRRKQDGGPLAVLQTLSPVHSWLLLVATVVTAFWVARTLTVWIRRRQATERNFLERYRSEQVMRHRMHGAAPHYRTDADKDIESEGGDNSVSNAALRLEHKFAALLAKGGPSAFSSSAVRKVLLQWVERLDQDIRNNVHGGIRWIRPYLLPELPGKNIGNGEEESADDGSRRRGRKNNRRGGGGGGEDRRTFFQVNRDDQGPMEWEKEFDRLPLDKRQPPSKPAVDYTDRNKYKYPSLQMQPPAAGGYPQLTSLKDMMAHWHQDRDYPGTIKETLLHFNYSNPVEREAARKFRDASLPFKMYDIPELSAATVKWTDDYVASHFGDRHGSGGGGSAALNWFQKHEGGLPPPPPARGTAQESPNNYFAWHSANQWDVEKMGLPPTRNNDWSFATWAKHARYADAVRLSPDQPHFYWQAGVDPEERNEDKSEWTFISRDLTMLSSPEPTFFMFNPEFQKGIQCRFGERGVVAATHYDSGQNMIAMITGAKRYILSPPKQCSKLGIFTKRPSPIFRHSLLNFGHIPYAHNATLNAGMSPEEGAWLERAAKAMSVETVLKAGEVLFVPSFWFHYIVSVQKSAQCNARSGVDEEGTTEFGNKDDVELCLD